MVLPRPRRRAAAARRPAALPARTAADSAARYRRGHAEIAARLAEALTEPDDRRPRHRAEGRRARPRPLPELARHGHRAWRARPAPPRGTPPSSAPARRRPRPRRVPADGGRAHAGELLAAAGYAALATGVGAAAGHVERLARGRTAARPRRGPGDARDRVRRAPTAAGPRAVGAARGERVGGRTRRPARRRPRRTGRLPPRRGRRPGRGRGTARRARRAAGRPDTGQVLLDGVPLPELRHDELRRAVGHAFARPALLGGTVGDTIALGPLAPRRSASPRPPTRPAPTTSSGCCHGLRHPCAAARSPGPGPTPRPGAGVRPRRPTAGPRRRPAGPGRRHRTPRHRRPVGPVRPHPPDPHRPPEHGGARRPGRVGVAGRVRAVAPHAVLWAWAPTGGRSNRTREVSAVRAVWVNGWYARGARPPSGRGGAGWV
ncbi:hypothetical protein NKH77_15765 [Streptomyces sp. M19]